MARGGPRDDEPKICQVLVPIGSIHHHADWHVAPLGGMDLLAQPPCKRVQRCCLRAWNNHVELNLLGHTLDPCWEDLWLRVIPRTHHVESHHPPVACDVAKQLPPSQREDLNWQHVATPLLYLHVVERLLKHCYKRNVPPTKIISCLYCECLFLHFLSLHKKLQARQGSEIQHQGPSKCGFIAN